MLINIFQLTENNFGELHLSYFWYKKKEEVKKLKLTYQLSKCEFKKITHTSADNTHDFELLLEGVPGAIRNSIQAIYAMETGLRKRPGKVKFHRATWELLRLRQQEFNSNPVISLNLLPNKKDEAIHVTVSLHN